MNLIKRFLSNTGQTAGAPTIIGAYASARDSATTNEKIERLLASPLMVEFDRQHEAELAAARQQHLHAISAIDAAYLQAVAAHDAIIAEKRATLEIARLKLKEAESDFNQAIYARSGQISNLNAARDRHLGALRETANSTIDDFIFSLRDEMDEARRHVQVTPAGSKMLQGVESFSTNGQAIEIFVRAASEAAGTAELMKVEVADQSNVGECLALLRASLPNWRTAPLTTFIRERPVFVRDLKPDNSERE